MTLKLKPSCVHRLVRLKILVIHVRYCVNRFNVMTYLWYNIVLCYDMRVV